MIVLSHPTGNNFVREAARALYDAGLLAAFYTCVAAPPDAVLNRLPTTLRRPLARRRFADIPRHLLRTYPWREALRLTARTLNPKFTGKSSRIASVDAVYRSLDRHVASRLGRVSATSVYAYEDGAEATFAAARALGLHCIYELPIAHWQLSQRLLHEEGERLPEWRGTLANEFDSEPKCERKQRELEMADVVVVPSEFVLNSLPASVRASKHCVVAPFGSPPLEGLVRQERAPGPLRVLFAGTLSQRKGLADLFEAMRILARPDIELVVMGSLLAPLAFYRRHCPQFRYEPPRPHVEVLKLMLDCDVLALPSIVEGRALVQQEALACGLPLIATRNAGCSELIVEGETGFLVPVRSPQALAERIAWFADHRSFLPSMRAAARRVAATCSWVRYRRGVLDAVSAARDVATP